MRNHGLAVVLGCLDAVVSCCQEIPEAATYQHQLASVPERIFMHFVENRTPPRAEAFFNDTKRSRYG